MEDKTLGLSEYKNFNEQIFYEKFHEKYIQAYNAFCKENKKANLNGWKYRIPNLIKSEVFVFYLFIFLSILVAFFFNKIDRSYSYIFILGVLSLLIFLCISVSIDFKNEEKCIANEVLDQLFQEENISVTESFLDKLINSSENIGSKSLRILKAFKKTHFYDYFRSVVLTVVGIYIGVFSSELPNSEIVQFFRMSTQLFDVIFLLSYIYLFFYGINYYFFLSINKLSYLYLEVLKDKKLTLVFQQQQQTKQNSEKSILVKIAVHGERHQIEFIEDKKALLISFSDEASQQ